MVYDVGEGQGVSVSTEELQIGDIVRYMRTDDCGIIIKLINPNSTGASRLGVKMWYKVEWFNDGVQTIQEDWFLNKVTPDV